MKIVHLFPTQHNAREAMFDFIDKHLNEVILTRDSKLTHEIALQTSGDHHYFLGSKVYQSWCKGKTYMIGQELYHSGCRLK